MELFNDENRISSILKNIEMQSVCSIDKIAGKLNVSAKTIRNDIKELNYLLGGYALISMNKGECKLIVFDPHSRGQFHQRCRRYIVSSFYSESTVLQWEKKCKRTEIIALR